MLNVQMLLQEVMWMLRTLFPFDVVAPDEALPSEELVSGIGPGTLAVIIAVVVVVIIAVVVIVCKAKKKTKEKAGQQ